MDRNKVQNRAPERPRENGVNRLYKNAPKGLINLGNTCYLNATLQCLARVSLLRDELRTIFNGRTSACLKRSNNDGDTKSLQLVIPNEGLQFSQNFIDFGERLLHEKTTFPSISPDNLRKELVTHYKQLNNFGQHDSFEALHCILDRIRCEEKLAWQRAVLNKMNSDLQVPEKVKDEIKLWGQCIKFSTTVDRIFGGVLVSSIQCNVCENTAIHFETFLNISLPIITDAPKFEPVVQNREPNNKKKQDKKFIKDKRQRNKRNFEPGSDVDNDGIEEDQSQLETKGRKKNKRSTKKNKYGKNRQVDDNVQEDEDEEEEEENEHQNESDQGDEVIDSNNEDEVDEEVNKNHGLEFDRDDDNCGAGLDEGPVDDGIQDIKDEMGSTSSSIDFEKKSASSSGDAADMEDNAEDTDSFSTVSVPKALDEGDLCSEFSAKSSVADAGKKTAIAQPEEENRAKELSSQTILVECKEDLITDLERSLLAYFEKEMFSGNNKIICDECTKKAQASGGEISDSRSAKGSDGSVRCDSLKRDLLLKPPAILTIHLKRYEKNGNQWRKCTKPVTFPINLDIRPYCSRLAWLGAEEGQYRLFGVVEHLGSLFGGHYVAYVAETEDGEVPAKSFIPTLEKPFPWPLNLHHLVYQLRRGHKDVLDGNPDAPNLSNQEDDRTWHYFSDTMVYKVPLSDVLNTKPYLLFYQRVK